MAYSVKFLRFTLTSLISFSIPFKISSALNASYFEIRLILISVKTNAQFKVLQTRSPKSSALLDMDVTALADGSKKEFLMPRINLTRTNVAAPVTSPATGLWVFNTNGTTGANAVQINNVYMWSGCWGGFCFV